MSGRWRSSSLLSNNSGFKMYGEAQSHILCILAERVGSAVAIRSCFVRESRKYVALRTMMLNVQDVNASIKPEAVVHH